MANEYWKMRGSYKSPLPIAKDRELLVDMNNGDVYFGWHGANVPLSNVAELQTLVSLLLAKKILNVDESFGGKSGYVVSVGSSENGFVLAPPLKGDKGDTPTITIGSVATGAPGTDATITNSGTDLDAVLHITIPRGFDGDMMKDTYDTDDDGKVNSAEVADSVAWAGVTDKPTTVSGYGITDAATLVDGKIPSSQLPSYVDDVLEYDDYASLPATGTSGIVYVTTDNNKQYRWSGSAYVDIVASPGTTDNIVEGSTNLWHTSTRVLSTVLTGLSTATNAAIAATDDVLAALGKLAARVNAIWDETDIDRIYIPVGATGVSYRVGCNCTFNYCYIDCLDLAGAADAPTSLTVSVAKAGTNQFTTGAITTAAATYDNTDFNADAGDLITVTVSNTTGVAGGVMIGLRWVRR